MYRKPAVERFGSFRELTRLGAAPDCDGGPAQGDGSTVNCDVGGVPGDDPSTS